MLLELPKTEYPKDIQTFPHHRHDEHDQVHAASEMTPIDAIIFSLENLPRIYANLREWDSRFAPIRAIRGFEFFIRCG